MADFTATRQPGDIMVCLTSPLQSQRYAEDVRIVKEKYGLKFAFFIHDIMPVTHPEWFIDDDAKKFRKALEDALLLSDMILTSSRHNCEEIAAFCAHHQLLLPPMRAIRFGDGFSVAPGVPAATPVDFPDEFVLCVSTIEVRKNHAFLLRVWRRLAERHGRDALPHLVLFGRMGWKMEDFAQELAKEQEQRPKIVLLSSGLSDAALHEAYRRCLFVVYPSLGEGWGLPVGEALAAGKFCVASDRCPLPQIGGDLADYFDPTDEIDAMAKLERAIFDVAYRNARTARVRGEYRPASWKDCARSVIDALTELEVAQQRSGLPIGKAKREKRPATAL